MTPDIKWWLQISSSDFRYQVVTSDIQHPWLCSHGVPTWCELSGGPVCDIWYWRCVDCDEPDCRSDCWDNYKTCLLLSLLDWQIYLTSGYFPSILRSNLSSLDRWKNLSQWSSQAEWYSVNQINWSHCSRPSVHSSMVISCSRLNFIGSPGTFCRLQTEFGKFVSETAMNLQQSIISYEQTHQSQQSVIISILIKEGILN